MATTATEACGKACLLILVKSHGPLMETCRPEECSAWVWDDHCDLGGNRLGHCVLAGDSSWPRPDRRKIGLSRP